MINTYLTTQIPKLATDTDFMTGIKDSDNFVCALAGTLLCGSCYAAGISSGIEDITTYPNATKKDAAKDTTENLDVVNGLVDFSK